MRIAELERREEQLLTIIERLSGSLASPIVSAPALERNRAQTAKRGHRLSDSVVAKARDLLAQGLTDSDVADQTGISRASVHNIRTNKWPKRWVYRDNKI